MGEARLYTTKDGKVVLYRMPGDAWSVARDEKDARFLTGLNTLEQEVRGIEVVLATPELGEEEVSP